MRNTQDSLALSQITEIISESPSQELKKRKPSPRDTDLSSYIAEAPSYSDISVPDPIHVAYVTAHAAYTPTIIDNIIRFTQETNVNALVINIKDGTATHLNTSIAHLVKRLREKNIYPIARIVVFQDDELARSRPDLAITTQEGTLWGKNGYYFVDPASREVWEETKRVSNIALDIGFKEINLDYIRFPDGDPETMVFPVYTYDRTKASVINEFSAYVTSAIKKDHPTARISADIFAYALLRNNDIGIGQRFIDLVDYYDIIAPMIYPSHYSQGNFGFENPAQHPYDVVFRTLMSGKKQLAEAGKKAIIRPWIQDFNLGALYDQEKIQRQIQAIEDAGYHHGWMTWNPSNIYSIKKYQPIPRTTIATTQEKLKEERQKNIVSSKSENPIIVPDNKEPPPISPPPKLEDIPTPTFPLF